MELLKDLASTHTRLEEAGLYSSYYVPTPLDEKMDRVLLFKWLCKLFNYSSYLHVGTDCAYSIGTIRNKSVSCNQMKKEDVVSTTEFFKTCTEQFDLIFLNGCREMNQVLLDVDNSLKCLAPNGTIVLIHCLPKSSSAAVWPVPANAYYWSGETWRAWMSLKNRADLNTFLLDCDWGLGLVRRGTQTPSGIEPGEAWPDFKRHLEDALQPKLVADLIEWLCDKDNAEKTAIAQSDNVASTQPLPIQHPTPQTIPSQHVTTQATLAQPTPATLAQTPPANTTQTTPTLPTPTTTLPKSNQSSQPQLVFTTPSSSTQPSPSFTTQPQSVFTLPSTASTLTQATNPNEIQKVQTVETSEKIHEVPRTNMGVIFLD